MQGRIAGEYLHKQSISPEYLQAKELHVIVAPDRHGMANVLGKDTDQLRAKGVSSVAALGNAALGLLGLRGVVAENTRPLVDSLLVVGRSEGGVDTAVVDLHLGAGSVVARESIGD